MEKDFNENNNVEKLLISLLISRGISTTTVAKIVGVSQGTISKMIPVSNIQEDVKNNGKK